MEESSTEVDASEPRTPANIKEEKEAAEANETSEEEFIALDPVDPDAKLKPLDPEGRYSVPASPDLFDEENILDDAIE